MALTLLSVIDEVSPLVWRHSGGTCTTCSAHARKETGEGHKLWPFTRRCWQQRSAALTDKTTAGWRPQQRSRGQSVGSRGNGIYFAVLWNVRSELGSFLFMSVRFLLSLLTGSICVSLLSGLIPVQSSTSVPVQSPKHPAQNTMAASPLTTR